MNVLIALAVVLSCSIADNGSASIFKEAQNAIVGGLDARRHQFPYQISLQKDDYLGTFEHICGGSILSPTFVVTAGHCVDADDGDSNLRVVAGLLKLDELNHRDVQIVDVIRTYVHSDYESDTDSGVSPNDIALVQLGARLRYTKAVKPILLPEPGAEPNGTVKLSGWGSTKDMYFVQDNPDRLQHATLYLMSYEACKDALVEDMGDSTRLTPSMVCTGSPFGIASGCFGDSGGPLQQNNRLIGVVSWVVRPCGTMGAPTMYTKTSYYVYFIRGIVGDL